MNTKFQNEHQEGHVCRQQMNTKKNACAHNGQQQHRHQQQQRPSHKLAAFAAKDTRRCPWHRKKWPGNLQRVFPKRWLQQFGHHFPCAQIDQRRVKYSIHLGKCMGLMTFLSGRRQTLQITQRKSFVEIGKHEKMKNMVGVV